jgi:predicted transcriptional regulator of viral defense system
MAYRSTRAALERLRDIAIAQGGYVTSKQAARAGYGSTHLAYHTRAGNLERAGTGIYRLRLLPTSAADELVRLALWSRDRSDRPQAVVSHVSALVQHGLTRLLPRAVHLTVPARFRKEPPAGVVLHRGVIENRDVEQREGYSVTTPLRALVDCANDADVPQGELDHAVITGIERGLVRREALVKAVREQRDVPRLAISMSRADDVER